MFTRKHESQPTDLRCVFYYVAGLTDELLVVLRENGHEDITIDDIKGRAVAMINDYDILCPDSEKCYFCQQPKDPGTLCACFKKRYLTVTNVPKIIARFPDNKVIETLMCRDCGTEFAVTARWAKRAHVKDRNYYPPTRCKRCHNEWQRTRSFAKIGDAVETPVIAEPQTEIEETAVE